MRSGGTAGEGKLGRLRMRGRRLDPGGEVTLAALLAGDVEGGAPGGGDAWMGGSVSLGGLLGEATASAPASKPADENSPRRVVGASEGFGRDRESGDGDGPLSATRRSLSISGISRDVKTRMMGTVAAADLEGTQEDAESGSPRAVAAVGAAAAGALEPLRWKPPEDAPPAPTAMPASTGLLGARRGMAQVTPRQLTRYIRARIARGVSVGRNALPFEEGLRLSRDLAHAAMATVDKELVHTLSQVPSFVWSDHGADEEEVDDIQGLLDDDEEVVEAFVEAVGAAVDAVVAKAASRPSSASLRAELASETSRLVALKLREEGGPTPLLLRTASGANRPSSK